MSSSSDTAFRVTATSVEAPPSAEPTALVLALGNPLRGDDGVGLAVLRQLQQCDPPVGVELVDGGTAGLETALLLQNRRRAIILDAADMGGSPGDWQRVHLNELRIGERRLSNSIHAAGLNEALDLGDALGILPPEVVLYLIQPAETGWEIGLSEPVRAAVPRICRALCADLRGGTPATYEGRAAWPIS